MFFLPNQKLKKNYLTKAIIWVVISIFLLLIEKLISVIILREWLDQHSTIKIMLDLGIPLLLAGIIIFYAFKSKDQKASKRTAFLYENGELYIFTTNLHSGYSTRMLNDIFGNTGTVVGLFAIANEQKRAEALVSDVENLKKIKEYGYFEKITKVRNLKKQKDGYKFRCIIESKNGNTREIKIFIKKVYENYNKLIEIVKGMNKQ